MTERFGEWGKLKVEDLFRGQWCGGGGSGR